MLIRPAGPGDIEPVLAVMAEAFGIELKPPTVHTLVASAPDGYLLVAESEGAIVGTAAAVGFGDTGWLGGIVVTPAARGAGLGRKLTLAALDALGPRKTVLLLASTLGRPIYDRLGFVAEGRYRVFIAGTKSVRSGNLIEPSRDVVLALDRRVTGEDRSLAIDASKWVATPDLSAVAMRPPWPALPIIGDARRAPELLSALIEPGMRLAVPEANAAAVSLLSLLGREREPVVRMRLGPSVSWDPSSVWGVFSLFFG